MTCEEELILLKEQHFKELLEWNGHLILLNKLFNKYKLYCRLTNILWAAFTVYIWF
jgi:hypothetical protein